MDIDKNKSEMDGAGGRVEETLLGQVAQYKQRTELMQQQAAGLKDTVNAKNLQLYELNKVIQSREAHIEFLKNLVKIKDKDISERDGTIREIMSGTVMQSMVKFKLFIDKLMPPGSGGARVFQSMVGVLQRMTKSGPAGQKQVQLQPPGNLAAESAGQGAGKAAGAPGTEWADGSGRRLASFLKDKQNKLCFPVFEKPAVSIIILTYNNAGYTYDCLESIIANTQTPYQVVIVDNGSKDETGELLQRLENVCLVKNEENLGFVGGCNQGAARAAAEQLLFLNNDTVVAPGWLSSLAAVLDSDPKCGVAGSKLVRFDGTLQEAGSIVWADGSALGYGKGDDPDKPQYCYLRSVDYCSACSLLVRKSIFDRVGGFDKRYAPAYYEDTDLCMAIRDLGYKVVYQPASVIYHHEYKGSSAEAAGRLMQANRLKFVEKWDSKLSAALTASKENQLKARDKNPKMSVLVLDDRVPDAAAGAGFPRASHMIKYVAGFGYRVTFFPAAMKDPGQPCAHEFQQAGIEVMYGEDLDLIEFAVERAGFYDMIIISRPHNMQDHYEMLRKFFPGAAVIYDAEAIFALRDMLKADVEKKQLDKKTVDRMLNDEIKLMGKADIVVTVSEAEKNTILQKAQIADVEVWGHPALVRGAHIEYQNTRDLLFVGSFIAGAGSPNEDAAVYFAREIFPGIRKKLDCHLYIVGSYPTEDVLKLAGPGITVTGYVEDIAGYYGRCRVFVVPTRFAAGIPLKLIEAMSYGIPSVVSPLIAGQLGLKDGVETMVAADKNAFIHKTAGLYSSGPLWQSVQANALAYTKNNFDPDVLRNKLKEIMDRGVQVRESRKR